MPTSLLEIHSDTKLWKAISTTQKIIIMTYIRNDDILSHIYEINGEIMTY